MQEQYTRRRTFNEKMKYSRREKEVADLQASNSAIGRPASPLAWWRFPALGAPIAPLNENFRFTAPGHTWHVVLFSRNSLNKPMNTFNCSFWKTDRTPRHFYTQGAGAQRLFCASKKRRTGFLSAAIISKIRRKSAIDKNGCLPI